MMENLVDHSMKMEEVYNLSKETYFQKAVEYLGSETWNDIQAGFLSDPPANGSLT